MTFKLLYISKYITDIIKAHTHTLTHTFQALVLSGRYRENDYEKINEMKASSM